MFYHHKNPHTHVGFVFLLSLLVAFILGRKSEQYGFTIVSRGCVCHDVDDEMDMMNDPNPSSYPQ